MASKPEVFEEDVTPIECTEFLEFADQLNIPLNQEYLAVLRSQMSGKGFNLDAFELGVKDSKVQAPENENFNDRRLQNALWRAWWRQKQLRFNTQKQLPRVLEQLDSPSMSMLRGREIGDIPTEYSIPCLKPHELPVIGTYVDTDITPGFSYRVRVNGTSEFLFGGKALVLQRVGAGYGKRLTFKDESILDNDNFFWSDSNPDCGFAFSIQVLSGGERFKVFDSFNKEVGHAEICHVNDEQQIACGCDATGKNVRVQMECHITFHSMETVPQSLRGKTTVNSTSGIAIARRMAGQKEAIVTEIVDVELVKLGICVLRSHPNKKV